ncbi:leucyl aminopeptidase, partial [Corynebacterium mastitidis]
MLSGLPARGALAAARIAKKVPEDARVILLPVFRGEEGPELPLTGLLDAAAARAVLSAAEAISFEAKPESLALLPLPDSLPAPGASCLA